MDSPKARDTRTRRNVSKRLQQKFFDKLKEEEGRWLQNNSLEEETMIQEKIQHYKELNYQHGRKAILAAIEYKEIATQWPAL